MCPCTEVPQGRERLRVVRKASPPLGLASHPGQRGKRQRRAGGQCHQAQRRAIWRVARHQRAGGQ